MKTALHAEIDLLNRAVAIDPKFAEAYSEIANAYYFLGRGTATPLPSPAASRPGTVRSRSTRNWRPAIAASP